MPDHRRRRSIDGLWRGAELACTSVTVLRVALAQLNPTVGDLDGNLAKLIDAYDRAEAAGCDIVAFPELSTTGYPPEDLVLKPGFVADNLDGAVDSSPPTRVAARPSSVSSTRTATSTTPRRSARTARSSAGTTSACCRTTHGVRRGALLHARSPVRPARAVRDRRRQGRHLDLRGHLEPVRSGRRTGRRRRRAEHQHQRARRSTPARALERERMVATRASDAHTAIVYVNQVGGQDELVFDGGSFVFDHEGHLLARAPQFVEELLIVDVPVPPVYRKRLLDPRGRITEALLPDRRGVRLARRARRADRRSSMAEPLDPDRELYDALVLGTRDYCARTASTTSSSGCPAGSTRRSWPASPSTRSAPNTCTACRCRRGTRATTRRPTPSCSPRTSASTSGRSRSSRRSRRTSTCWRRRSRAASPGLTYENIQSRCRGLLLMALSNEFGWMVLDHREQERDGRRLLHHLRRLRRRLRRDQGRLEDSRLRPVSLRQPCRPAVRSFPRP